MSLNRAALMGRLVTNPELRKAGDTSVTKFTIAVPRAYVAKGAERVSDFVDIIAWRATAEFISKFFHKGQMIAVDGKIQTGTYTDKDGNKRKSFEILADNVFFCESKNDKEKPENGDGFAPVEDDGDLPF